MHINTAATGAKSLSMKYEVVSRQWRGSIVAAAVPEGVRLVQFSFFHAASFLAS